MKLEFGTVEAATGKLIASGTGPGVHRVALEAGARTVTVETKPAIASST